ncbi:hypothetical protein H2202_000814 [Exophiala xenobiotica]|nr:hypothetical protein H2202_000814 [Exophiala xenobiotica]KAK5195913.1 hypothetical protein LTR92_004854 [Exophiala xenobiotica]KAK5209908.1 hypothetical protein LTR41_004540 [Exophiala xenobiotica]KAK5225783.1 hypothetical protein LTR72_003686 [Exophiala xenobiotica]KAK5298603.1 hypothetical protein LTR14_002454 [Exophiala xenobiotica]
MSANSGSGGVRNLRAMFENKASDQSTSPPSRGRSPNPSEISNGSRPVSKVRASFVAVERPGENGSAPILGLRRPSEVSNREENKENSTTAVWSPERRAASRNMSSLEGPKMEEQSHNGSTNGGLGTILKGSAFAESTPSKDKSEVKNLNKALASSQVQEKLSQTPSKPKDETKSAAMVEKMHTNGGKPGPPPATTLQTTKSAQPVKAPPTRQIVTKTAPTAKPNPSPRSPVTSKSSPRTPTSPIAHIRGGPAKIKGVMESAKRAQEARVAAKQKSEQPNQAQATVPKPNIHQKQVTHPVKKEKTPTSPRAVRPKSSTRPAKLPAAATATTASAAAKHDTQNSPTEPETRKSIAKRPSTISMRPPRASTSSTTGTLAKKTSRASLANDRPKSRVSTSKPDEGFLARMMRPTTSSAQKAHEKAQVNSPPRTKTAPTNKHKEAPKQKAPPPKMQLETRQDVESEKKTKDNDGQRVLPEVALASPLQVVKEDPMQSTGKLESVSAPHTTVDSAPSVPTETKEPATSLPAPTAESASSEPAKSVEAVPSAPSEAQEPANSEAPEPVEPVKGHNADV